MGSSKKKKYWTVLYPVLTVLTVAFIIVASPRKISGFAQKASWRINNGQSRSVTQAISALLITERKSHCRLARFEKFVFFENN
jgi:di/tricarboxylate transporter